MIQFPSQEGVAYCFYNIFVCSIIIIIIQIMKLPFPITNIAIVIIVAVYKSSCVRASSECVRKESEKEGGVSDRV